MSDSLQEGEPMTNNKLPSGVMYHIIPDKDDKRTMAQKLADLCQAFKRKVGTWPSMIWMNPSTLGDYVSPNGLTVTGDKRILTRHYLVGPLPQTEV